MRRRPAGQRKRLTAAERECLVQLLDSVERLPRSGRTAAIASALPLVILPALGPGLPPGFLEVDGMPPVPDKALTGRFFGRHVMEFQNWTLASNAQWRLTDEQLTLLWQAEFLNSRTRYTMKSVRTELQRLRTVIDIRLSNSSMSRGTRGLPHGAYSGPVDPGALLPGTHRAENEPPTQGVNQLVSSSVLTSALGAFNTSSVRKRRKVARARGAAKDG